MKTGPIFSITNFVDKSSDQQNEKYSVSFNNFYSSYHQDKNQNEKISNFKTIRHFFEENNLFIPNFYIENIDEFFEKKGLQRINIFQDIIKNYVPKKHINIFLKMICQKIGLLLETAEDSKRLIKKMTDLNIFPFIAEMQAYKGMILEKDLNDLIQWCHWNGSLNRDILSSIAHIQSGRGVPKEDKVKRLIKWCTHHGYLNKKTLENITSILRGCGISNRKIIELIDLSVKNIGQHGESLLQVMANIRNGKGVLKKHHIDQLYSVCSNGIEYVGLLREISGMNCERIKIRKDFFKQHNLDKLFLTYTDGKDRIELLRHISSLSSRKESLQNKKISKHPSEASVILVPEDQPSIYENNLSQNKENIRKSPEESIILMPEDQPSQILDLDCSLISNNKKIKIDSSFLEENLLSNSPQPLLTSLYKAPKEKEESFDVLVDKVTMAVMHKINNLSNGNIWDFFYHKERQRNEFF